MASQRRSESLSRRFRAELLEKSLGRIPIPPTELLLAALEQRNKVVYSEEELLVGLKLQEHRHLQFPRRSKLLRN